MRIMNNDLEHDISEWFELGLEYTQATEGRKVAIVARVKVWMGICPGLGIVAHQQRHQS